MKSPAPIGRRHAKSTTFRRESFFHRTLLFPPPHRKALKNGRSEPSRTGRTRRGPLPRPPRHRRPALLPRVRSPLSHSTRVYARPRRTFGARLGHDASTSFMPGPTAYLHDDRRRAMMNRRDSTLKPLTARTCVRLGPVVSCACARGPTALDAVRRSPFARRFGPDRYGQLAGARSRVRQTDGEHGDPSAPTHSACLTRVASRLVRSN